MKERCFTATSNPRTACSAVGSMGMWSTSPTSALLMSMSIRWPVRTMKVASLDSLAFLAQLDMRASEDMKAEVRILTCFLNLSEISLTHTTAQSPKDDLESLGYMLLYFIKGKLPWQGLKAHDGAEKERLVMEKKKSLTADQLCAGLPVEFAQYMQYVKSLRRGETPDYSKLRERFQAIATREGMEYDNVFDWTEREYLKQVMINDSD